MKLLYVAANWFFGCSLLIIGMATFLTYPLPGFLIVGSSCFLLPPIREFAFNHTNITIDTKLRVTSVFMAFIAGLMSIDSAETSMDRHHSTETFSRKTETTAPDQTNRAVLHLYDNRSKNDRVAQVKAADKPRAKPEAEEAVKPVPEAAEFVKETAYVNVSALNVRSVPSKSGDQLGTLNLNEKVVINKSSGKWVRVKGDRLSGRVYSSYVSDQPTVDEAEKPIFAANQLIRKPAHDDSTIRKVLISQSIDSYDGACPCPYNRTSNGSRCGKRSAYSRPGGAAPLCFDNDISEQMIVDFENRL